MENNQDMELVNDAEGVRHIYLRYIRPTEIEVREKIEERIKFFLNGRKVLAWREPVGVEKEVSFDTGDRWYGIARLSGGY